MNQRAHPDGLPDEVLQDVASTVGTRIALLTRLPGGINAGATRIQFAGGWNAVLKTESRTRPSQLDDTLRAQRIVGHMRGLGYPTPAWLGVGATATHVWCLMDFVDAAPARELTSPIVEQLMAIVELQAGQASEPHDHSAYARRVVAGKEPVVAAISDHSPEVSTLVQRALLMCADTSGPSGAPDMVHADFNPSNILVRNGAVAAIVDIGNAGSGTRATDLTTLLWHTFREPLDGVRVRLWARIFDAVGWEGAAVLTATQILLQLEWPIRLAHHDLVPQVVSRGHRVLDELMAPR